MFARAAACPEPASLVRPLQDWEFRFSVVVPTSEQNSWKIRWVLYLQCDDAPFKVASRRRSERGTTSTLIQDVFLKMLDRIGLSAAQPWLKHHSFASKKSIISFASACYSTDSALSVCSLFIFQGLHIVIRIHNTLISNSRWETLWASSIKWELLLAWNYLTHKWLYEKEQAYISSQSDKLSQHI